MVTKQILNLARRCRKRTPFSPLHQPNRSASTSPAISEPEIIAPPPQPQSPNATRRSRIITRAVNSKPREPKNPDPRFTQHGSPHPILVDHTRILSVPETRVTTLPNGLRVGTESSLSDRTATVGVWVDAGSRYESEVTHGTAHFLEHMVFKGTWRRTFEDLAMEVETMGGQLNACTSKENTVYYLQVMAEDVPKAIEILADMLQNSYFSSAGIDDEREIIIGEMEETESIREEHVFHLLQSGAFKNSSMGRTILGTADSISRITRADIQNFISTHYTAPRMVIAAAGAVKHDDIVRQVKKHFTKLSNDPTSASEWVAKDPAVFTGCEKRIVEDGYRLAHCVIAFRGASWTDSDSIALRVMEFMLGSWKKISKSGKHIRQWSVNGSELGQRIELNEAALNSSELARRIELNEAAESMMTFNHTFKDIGLFGLYVTAEPECLDDLAYIIMHELSKLSYSVSEADVTRARNQLKTSMLLENIGSMGIAADIGCQLLRYGRIIPYTELMARIDAVDANTVQRVANRFIYDKDIAVAATGPVKDLPDYNWFRRKTCWERS